VQRSRVSGRESILWVAGGKGNEGRLQRNV
jgi:hypothetical protein